MSRRYNLRNVSEVVESLKDSEQSILAIDTLPSDDDGDDLEIQSGSESEVDEESQPPIESNRVEESDEENPQQDEESPTRKRARIEDRKRGIVPGSKNHTWYRKPREKSQRLRNRRSSHEPTPVGEGKNARTPMEAWNLLLTESMLQKVQVHTNSEIRRFRESMESETRSEAVYTDVDFLELAGFFGLMYFSGLQKTAEINLEDLWSNEFGSALYRATMSLKRYKFLSRVLRFDDKTTRTERIKADKFAPIRELWDEFASNCTKNYDPASLCTVDEQVLEFRGRCSFKVCNKSNTDKHGVKIVMLNDSITHYMLTAEPYVGMVIAEDGEAVPSYYVRKLSQPIHGSTRTVTCDNWFSSVEVFDRMLKDHSVTMVGTLRKSNAQIPDSFKRPGEVGSAKFAFDDTKTLLSYTAKKSKIVILLSTFHHAGGIDQRTRIPEIIKFHNANRGGTEAFDHMCQEYTTARKTLRWPMRVWMGMMDQAAINAAIIHNFNAANALMSRRDFLKTLVMGLVEPHLRQRLNIPRLRRDLRMSIQVILKIDVEVVQQRSAPSSTARGRCCFCPRSHDRKVRVFCDTCSRAVCNEHRYTSCPTCFAQL